MIYLVETGQEEPLVFTSKNGVFQQIKDDEMVTKIWEESEQTNPILRSFRDVSEDIANEFFNNFSQDYSDYSYVPDFIQNNLDEDLVRNILSEENTRSDYAEHNTMNREQQGI